MHHYSPSKKPTDVVKDGKALLRLNASLYGFLGIEADIRFCDSITTLFVLKMAALWLS